MTTKCSVCGRFSADDETLCRYHKKAYLNLREAYETWKVALEISWEQYLDLVATNENTGEWSKEIIHYLMNEKQEETRIPPSVSPTDSPAPL